MTTIELEKTVNQAEIDEVNQQEIDKEALCHKLCVNILESLLDGYNELKDRVPEKEQEFLFKIKELQKQIAKQ